MHAFSSVTCSKDLKDRLRKTRVVANVLLKGGGQCPVLMKSCKSLETV